MLCTVLLQDAVYSNLPRRMRDEAQRTSAWEAVFTRNKGICVQPKEITWFNGERILSSQGCRNYETFSLESIHAVVYTCFV